MGERIPEKEFVLLHCWFKAISRSCQHQHAIISVENLSIYEHLLGLDLGTAACP